MTGISKKTCGFTLVELSIVMIIIGLLLGGILKGAELVTNARISRTIQSVSAYRAATNTFLDTYKYLPGDLPNAGGLLNGCVPPDCVAAGGNGDSYIGTPRVSNWSHDDQSAPNTEATQYWLHLLRADLINDSNGKNIQEWGKPYPSASIGGGFQIANVEELGINSASGHYFILRLMPTGDPMPSQTNGAALSPKFLSRIEKKFDDNSPTTGIVISDDNFSKCWNATTKLFLESSDSRVCIAAFKY